MATNQKQSFYVEVKFIREGNNVAGYYQEVIAASSTEALESVMNNLPALERTSVIVNVKLC